MIDEKEVKHIAKLARISLTDKEVEKFSGQLSSVFEYMEILNEIDTSKVEPTSQVTGLKNISRDDKIKSDVDPEALLKCSELPLERRQIRVKPVFE